jgi:D-lactate dehydrogenase (cytochrome)
MTAPRVRTRPPTGAVRPSGLVDASESACRAVLEDAAHFPGGHAAGLALPASEAEIATLLRAGTPLLPIGAQSSLTGGATPRGEVVVSMARFDAIGAVGAGHITVGAGVSLDALQAALSNAGRWYPPVPTYTGATVGGVVATNAAGPATFKHGDTRRWVRGLTVVLACGEVLDLERGQAVSDRDAGFAIDTSSGTLHVPVPRTRRPEVPKCSAGYLGADPLDLLDVFVGAEGTLGIVTAAVLETAPRPAARILAMVPVPSVPVALDLVEALRAEARRTWATGDPAGLDLAAIEHLDARSLGLLRDEGVTARFGLVLPPGTDVLLFADIESAQPIGQTEAWADVERASAAGTPASPLVTFCRILAQHGVFDATELALPGDRTQAHRFTAIREAVPEAVNRRVARARLDDSRISKTAADIVVPTSRVADLLAGIDGIMGRADLAYAVWGHISDGNLHPNVLPASWDQAERGRAAVLEIGRLAIALGGSPLAEHGVGRNPVKQHLLRLLHGEDGMASMRAVRQALDPDGRLSPGVLF